jgi:hypothetical protein
VTSSFFMTEEDLKAVLAKYQQKAFELYNTNIVLETQVEQLTKNIEELQRKTKRNTKTDGDFE